jgi:ParB/RepB/Spo0J family partition protein
MISTAKRERKQRKETNGQPKAVDLVDVPRRVTTLAVEPREIPVDAIARSPYQVRQDFPEEEIRELAESIAIHGQLSPIIVREAPDLRLTVDRYELVEGERRWRAVKSLGWETIRAEVHPLSDAQARAIVLVSAIQRKGLNAIEEAMAFKQAIEAGDAAGPTELARQLGLSQGHVSNRLRLLELPEDWQRRVISGEIPATHARAALQLKAFPYLLTDLVQVFEDWKSWNDGTPTGDDFEDMVSQVASRNGRPIGNNGRYVNDLGKCVPAYKPTGEERQALEILTLGEGKQAAEYATNVELWEQLQKAHEEKWIAKQRAKACGANPTKGSKGGTEPEEERARTEKQAEIYRRRLRDVVQRALCYFIAQNIVDCTKVGRDQQSRVLLHLFTASALSAAETLGYLEDSLQTIGVNPRFSNIWPILAKVADGDVVDVEAQFLARLFWDENDAGPAYRLDGDELAAIASHCGVDLVESWQREQLGPVSLDYWQIHTKDQLAELAGELGISFDKGATKDGMIAMLHRPGNMKKCPKELAKIKRK